MGEPDQDGDEWEPADCGLLLGYYGLCPRPQTQAPGQGAPLLITCLCPILEGLVDIHRVSQGLGKGKKQGPRTSWKRTRHFPWEPGSSSSGGARSKMSHRIPGGGNWGGGWGWVTSAGGERPGAGPAHPHGPWPPGALSGGVYDQAWPWASRPVRQPIESQIISTTFYCPRITTSTNPEYSLEGLMLKLMRQYFGRLTQEPTH